MGEGTRPIVFLLPLPASAFRRQYHGRTRGVLRTGTHNARTMGNIKWDDKNKGGGGETKDAAVQRHGQGDAHTTNRLAVPAKASSKSTRPLTPAQAWSLWRRRRRLARHNKRPVYAEGPRPCRQCCAAAIDVLRRRCGDPGTVLGTAAASPSGPGRAAPVPDSLAPRAAGI